MSQVNHLCHVHHKAVLLSRSPAVNVCHSHQQIQRPQHKLHPTMYVTAEQNKPSNHQHRLASFLTLLHHSAAGPLTAARHCSRFSLPNGCFTGCTTGYVLRSCTPAHKPTPQKLYSMYNLYSRPSTCIAYMYTPLYDQVGSRSMLHMVGRPHSWWQLPEQPLQVSATLQGQRCNCCWLGMAGQPPPPPGVLSRGCCSRGVLQLMACCQPTARCDSHPALTSCHAAPSSHHTPGTR